ncbi:NlpC/P60 family protein [Ahrensia sp. 13_GOM-1096m]|uniref:C40 family peptidase n=1 Tax=Ahrensia sp. 13_GOM-1096m TaxID=1380380 RepID=UPI000479DFBE|nr:NlpC/P60 family protein [Ahrensia sp. 13_GOM-1096m]
MSEKLDRRIHAFRDDLASEALKGKITAGKFVRGERRRVSSSVVDMRPKPDINLGIDTQMIYGDMVRVFDVADGWAWCQSLRDNYVGYVADDQLAARDITAPPSTHLISAPRTFAYPEADMKSPHSNILSVGSSLAIVGEAETRGTRYLKCSKGQFYIERHLVPIDQPVDDYVSIAEKLIHTPYLWGGSSAFGIDCSGLVQLSLLLAGKKVQRDSDMQAASIGTELGFSAMNGGLQRGDLVFWKGHVGIMRDEQELIHANGHTMDVAVELLEDAIERIGYLYGFPTTLRRP